MPRLKRRGTMLHFDYFDASGERVQVSSKPKDGSHPGFRVGQEAEAQKALDAIVRSAEAQRELFKKVDGEAEVPLPKTGVTIAMCWSAWVRARSKEPETAKAAKVNVWQGRDHVLPLVGHCLLTDFKPDPHAKAYAKALQQRGLASSSVLTLWATLHTMFKWAVIKGLVAANPCVVERKVLPKKKDKDPLWRRTAIYLRGEVETLISDERLSLRDRVLHGILFLSGLRPQEMSALRFRHWDTTWEPLALLDVQVAWDSEYRVEKETKTGKQRLIPVHPTLAKLLGEWRLSGWETYVGRKPTPEDLVVPSVDDEATRHMRNTCVADIVHRDLKRLGLRKRRAYDARRTFISLCRGDLVPKDIVEMWTHGRKGEVIDLYTDIDWPAHCREMLKLKVSLKEGVLLQMYAANGGNWDNHRDSLGASKKKPSNFESLPGQMVVGPSGFEPRRFVPQASTNANKSAEPLVAVGVSHPAIEPGLNQVVPLSHPTPLTLTLTLALRDALATWEASPDRAALRRDLRSILGALEEP